MGAGASKLAAKQAASSTIRQYPRTPSTATNAALRPPTTELKTVEPTGESQAHACEIKDRYVDLDATDPNFAKLLRQLGAVQPSPTYSPSSRFDAKDKTQITARQHNRQETVFPDPRNNPAVVLLRVRQSIQEAADAEFLQTGRSGHQGRRYLDVGTIRQALVLRDRGIKAADIEASLDLKKGVLDRLGRPGIVGAVNSPGA